MSTAVRAPRAVGPAAAVRVAQGVIYVDDGVGVTAYDRASLAQLWTTVLDDNGGVVRGCRPPTVACWFATAPATRDAPLTVCADAR